jgi:hypothetical protein
VREIAATIAMFVLAMVVLFGGLSWLINQTSFPSQVAEIEQLRLDSANVDPAQAEDVIGQVTSWNQYIRSMQINNTLWWAGWTIPDEWNNIELIEVPQ